jgi:CubicO group peptidase (beta-lactamase class C family)
MRRNLNPLVDGELGVWMRWRTSRHLDECTDCATEFAEIQQLSAQARRWRTVAAPASLQTRIAAVILSESEAHPATTGARLEPSWRWNLKGRSMKRALALSLSLLLMAVIWGISTRDNTALGALKRMEAAVSGVRSAHVWLEVIELDGRRWIQRELWYQEGRWRLSYTGRGIQVYRDGTLWGYNPREKTIESRPADSLPGRHWSGFTFKAISSDFIRWGPSGVNVRRLGSAQIEGREIAHYFTENADDAPYATRAIIKVDTATDLPLEIEKQHQTDREWITRLIVKFQFNQPLPESLFEPASLRLEQKGESPEAALDSLVPNLLKQEGVPGVSIAFIKGGEVVWAKGYGLADKSKGATVGLTTRFNIGSVSKTLTAWTVMTLVEKGQVVLDAPVDRYLKRWHLPKSDFDNNQVTVRRLLSHTAGLSVYPVGVTADPAGLFRPGDKLPALEEALSRSRGSFGRLRVIHEPGTRYEYNNGGYAILQLLVEDVTGETFADYMQHAIFHPLRMSDTGYTWSPELQASVATPYNRDGEAWPHYLGVAQGSGGVYTTASDLARFVAAVSGTESQPPGRGVLKPQTVQQMIVPADGTGGVYGLGYKMAPVSKDVQLVTHDGANEGWKAMFLIHPQKGDGVVILTNGDQGGRIMAPIACACFALTTVDLSPLCQKPRQ